jgi:DNA-binding NtrC family response regulator
MENKVLVFLVDDDKVFLKSLEIDFLDKEGFEIKTFPTGESCLTALDLKPDVVILDYNLDGIEKTAMNGLETLDKIKNHCEDIPVIMLSSQDQIEVAVNCMHHKAFDYIIKSETAFLRIKKVIGLILKHRKMEAELRWYMARM